MMMVELYTDGSCNPVKKLSRTAWVRVTYMNPNVNNVGKYIERRVQQIQHGTNNQAEYYSLINALCDNLQFAKNAEGKSKIHIFMDSMLVVNQIAGHWRVHSEQLKELRKIARKYLKLFDCDIKWVPRYQNLAGKLLE